MTLTTLYIGRVPLSKLSQDIFEFGTSQSNSGEVNNKKKDLVMSRDFFSNQTLDT